MEAWIFSKKSIEEAHKYNFEFECENEEYIKMDSLKRYFTYKATAKNCRNSGYENGKRFAINAFDMLGELPDCDGSGDAQTPICCLTRSIYRILWSWQDYDGNIERYGMIEQDIFDKMGPETMHSAQTAINEIVCSVLSNENGDEYLKHKKGNVSINYILELYSNPETKQIFIRDLKEIPFLEEFLCAYHTIGNFILVPSYFNPYRATIVNDYWDKSLSMLREKRDVWTYQTRGCSHEIAWDRKNFMKYINLFFLWDYIEEEGEIVEIFEQGQWSSFFRKAIELIYRRGIFICTMLKVNDLNKDYYIEMKNKVFNSDKIYRGYKEVFEKLKTLDCYINDKSVRKLINSDEMQTLKKSEGDQP